MSRTWRQAPRHPFRRPRANGTRRAVMETLEGEIIPATRSGAIPPDAGERFSSREVNGAVERYLLNAWSDGHGLRRLVRRAQRRFGLTYHDAFAAMRAAVDRSGMAENGEVARRPYSIFTRRDGESVVLERLTRNELKERLCPSAFGIGNAYTAIAGPFGRRGISEGRNREFTPTSSPLPPSLHGPSWPERLSSQEPSLRPLQARPSSRRGLSWWSRIWRWAFGSPSLG